MRTSATRRIQRILAKSGRNERKALARNGSAEDKKDEIFYRMKVLGFDEYERMWNNEYIPLQEQMKAQISRHVDEEWDLSGGHNCRLNQIHDKRRTELEKLFVYKRTGTPHEVLDYKESAQTQAQPSGEGEVLLANRQELQRDINIRAKADTDWLKVFNYYSTTNYMRRHDALLEFQEVNKKA